MTEQSRDQLVAQLKAEVHRNPDLTAMDDGQLRALIDRVLENKIQWARTSSHEAYRELSSMNFRERRSITGAVFESIRGLGVLGQIIAYDTDIDEGEYQRLRGRAIRDMKRTNGRISFKDALDFQKSV